MLVLVLVLVLVRVRVLVLVLVPSLAQKAVQKWLSWNQAENCSLPGAPLLREVLPELQLLQSVWNWPLLQILVKSRWARHSSGLQSIKPAVLRRRRRHKLIATQREPKHFQISSYKNVSFNFLSDIVV